ncbi:MAG: aminotransferase class V-fold PLP-dependent enzyme [Myxococcaceae bacterium]|nr:aminotransferase class V-fold PLP-dependent enzyme [Myxococcaceae bacterium]MCI0670360.1 aminotransferase class V-fold PLP-dependent enzyme [Myxococcaceae bacterium]
MTNPLYPYAERFGVLSGMPERGMPAADILGQLKALAAEEDHAWEGGKCSGTMYSGDREHYALINQVFAMYSHVNALQRDMCPSMTRFESEILAMTLDMLNGQAVTAANHEHRACGVIGAGGTESILHSILAYRDKALAERGITAPQMIWPDTAHPAFLKAAHLFGVELIVAPTDPTTTQVDLDFVRKAITDRTVVLIGSAGNYPYGTIDPIEALSDLALEHGIGLHVDGCLGGFILPWGEKLGYDLPRWDFRVPGVTSISADAHKYGYGPKGLSVLAWRDKSYRKYDYYIEGGWKGGLYASSGLLGSRSGGIIAASWAAMVELGAAGYTARARKIFETSFAMQDAVRSHPELRLMGKPTFCFSFTSDAFNVYHVNDYMVTRGWRFNGQQRPPAIHMCVTGPQTQAGVVKTFADDLTAGVAYAHQHRDETPMSGSMYGGAGGSEDHQALAEGMGMYLDAIADGPI